MYTQEAFEKLGIKIDWLTISFSKVVTVVLAAIIVKTCEQSRFTLRRENKKYASKQNCLRKVEFTIVTERK